MTDTRDETEAVTVRMPAGWRHRIRVAAAEADQSTSEHLAQLIMRAMADNERDVREIPQQRPSYESDEQLADLLLAELRCEVE